MPGDKSISHRALMLGAMAEGETIINGLSLSKDVKSTLRCLESLGITIEEIKRDKAASVIVQGGGLRGFKKPESSLLAGNSGTTMRLLSGILAGQYFTTTITGDSSLKRRPMKRIVEPLMQMGANISCNKNFTPPLTITGGRLKARTFKLWIPSAQVKSCIMLAAFYADGVTVIEEPAASRDHTERMIELFGAEIDADGLKISLKGGQKLAGTEVMIPGDISSASFFLVAGSLVEDSLLTIKDVGINPLRTGIIAVLKQMGAHISSGKERIFSGEPVADLQVCSSELRGIEITGDIIPKLIDEIPVLAVAASMAKGKTVIKGASELRVKEADRIKAVVNNLRKMGARVDELKDGMIIYGGNRLDGAVIDTYGDHRIEMAFAIAALAAEEETIIKNAGWSGISFPGFYETIANVIENEK